MVSSHEYEMLLRLMLSIILGGLVGLERGSGDRPAGFRTHILVCAGSALFMLVSMYGYDGYDAHGAEYPSNRDASRIAAQVVSGIGFLGAGTIMHEGITVRGLTTAASLWMVSAIGLACGAGMYIISIVSTVIMLVTLVTFHSWEKRFAGSSRNARKFIKITAENQPGIITAITSYLTENGIKVRTLNVKDNARKNEIVLELYLKVHKGGDDAEIIRDMLSLEGIISMENIG